MLKLMRSKIVGRPIEILLRVDLIVLINSISHSFKSFLRRWSRVLSSTLFRLKEVFFELIFAI